MGDYKQDVMEQRLEDELRPLIAKQIGIRPTTLDRYPYEREGGTLVWGANGAPKKAVVRNNMTEIQLPDAEA